MPELKNLKHEKFINEYIELTNGTKAYANTYPNASQNTARINSSQLLSKTNIRQRAIEILNNKVGSRVSVLIQDLIDRKQATKTIVIDKIERLVADTPSQLTAISMLLKLHGLLTPQALQYQDNRQLNVTLNSNDINDLKQVVSDLKSMRTRTDKISGKV